MSSLHDHESGEDMLVLVDELRITDKIEENISLPQIVVVGQQSSGKISVLHAISGIQFPTDDGLCTQFPTEIILRREDFVRIKASIRHHAGVPDQRCSDFEAFRLKWQDTDLASLNDIISDTKRVLHLDDRNRFSADSLVLEICGPDQENLSLIDLPGFFVSTQTDQSSTGIVDFNETAQRYVSNDRAVVLAIICGNNELENHVLLERMKLDIDFRTRTLGVITDPDAIEPGSQREHECVELIQQEPRGLGYEWHILRSVKYSEPKAGTSDQEVNEIQFFEQISPWNRLSSKYVGSRALKQRLALILENKIAESLRGIEQEIDLRLEKIHTQLENLGKTRQSPGELREYLCERARMFEVETHAMLNGSPSSLMDGFTNQSPSLRVYVQSKHEQFASEMFDKAQTWKLDMDGKDNAEQLRQIWSDKADGTAAINPDILATLLFDEISQHRGRELPNLLHPDWASTMFRRQSQRWLKTAQAHGDDIYRDVLNATMQAVERVVEEDTADRLLREIVGPALRERKRVLDDKLKELYRPYTLPSIYSVSRKYKGFVDEMGIKEGANEYTQCCNILRSADAFYQVAVNVFTENVVSLGVENCLLNDLSDVLDQRLFYQMSDEKLEFLGSESEEKKQSRSQLLEEKEQFEKARDQVRSALRKQRSQSTRKAQPHVQRSIMVDSILDTVSGDKPCSVQIAAATPPMTPTRPSDNNKTPISAKSLRQDPISPKSAPSLSYETTPSTNIEGLWSSRHSRSTGSVSSYNGSPVLRKTKNRRSLSWGASPVMTVADVDLMPFQQYLKVDFGAKNESVLPVTSQDDDEEL